MSLRGLTRVNYIFLHQTKLNNNSNLTQVIRISIFKINRKVGLEAWPVVRFQVDFSIQIPNCKVEFIQSLVDFIPCQICL